MFGPSMIDRCCHATSFWYSDYFKMHFCVLICMVHYNGLEIACYGFLPWEIIDQMLPCSPLTGIHEYFTCLETFAVNLDIVDYFA